MNDTLYRILELMKKRNLTAVAMEDYLGISRGSFSNWKRGMGRSYFEYKDRIADRLGVTIDYLIRGKEIKTDTLSSQEIELIENFRCLTPEAKELMIKNVRLLACV